MTALTVVAPAAELAERINAAVVRAQEAGREAVARAGEAGALLLEAKKAVGHGGWEAWVEAKCTCSVRTAQAYMRLAREMPKLEPAKAQRVADLSLRDALSAVASDARSVRALPPPLVEKVLEAAPEAGLRQPLKRAANEQRYRAEHVPTRQAEPVAQPSEPSQPPPGPDPELGWAVLKLLGERTAASPWLTPEIIRETLIAVSVEVQDRGLAGATAAFLHEYGDELEELAA